MTRALKSAWMESRVDSNRGRFRAFGCPRSSCDSHHRPQADAAGGAACAFAFFCQLGQAGVATAESRKPENVEAFPGPPASEARIPRRIIMGALSAMRLTLIAALISTVALAQETPTERVAARDVLK